MSSMTDSERAQVETVLRQRLAELAEHAPTAVHLPGEVPVVAVGRTAPRPGRRAGVVAAVTALIGAGGFTTYSFLAAGGDDGAATPQEAVTAFVTAAEHEDVIGMIAVTLPEEVGALRSSIDSITSDAKRTGLLADQFDSSGVRGIDVSVDHLALDANFLEGGLAMVTATSGTAGVKFDPSAFPFGDKLRALLGETRSGTASFDLGTSNPPALLMTVEHSGRWYVSVEYTIAEYVRRSAGWDLPNPVSRTPVGFDSPEAAVTGFYERVAALDVQAALDTFAPGEDAMAWLAGSWMPDAQARLDRAHTDGWSVAVSGLTYETLGNGDNRTLRPVSFTVEGTVPAALNADSSTGAATLAGPQPFKIERADGCTTFTGAGARSLFGLDNSPVAKKVDGGYQLCGSSDALGGLGLLAVGGSVTDLPAIAVVQSGGKWYVSPLGTTLASEVTNLHDTADGSSLFDSPLAPLLYGVSRANLESVVKGERADQVDPACLPALVVDGGTVTGVVADPPPDAVRSCANSSFGSATSSGVTVVGKAQATPAPVVDKTPTTTP